MNEKWYIDATVVCADFQGEVNINQLVIFEMWFHVKDYQLLKRPFYNSNHKRLFICFIEIYLIVSIYLWCFGVLLFCLGLCFFVFHSCYFVYWCFILFCLILILHSIFVVVSIIVILRFIFVVLSIIAIMCTLSFHSLIWSNFIPWSRQYCSWTVLISRSSICIMVRCTRYNFCLLFFAEGWKFL